MIHLEQLNRIERALEHIEERLDRNHERQNAMNANLQRAIDAIAKNKSVSDSIKAGTDLLAGEVTAVQADITDQGTQIAALKQQIADLQAQIANGGTVSADDLSALNDSAASLEGANAELTQSATDLGDANTKLGAAVPAATPVASGG